MTIITVSRAATLDEVAREMDRRGAVIERLEANLEHWRQECGKLNAQVSLLQHKLASVRLTLKTWDTPTDMDVEDLVKAIKIRIAELESINTDYKNRISELLEETAS